MKHWHVRNVPFKFQLSDWTLLTIPLRLKCRSMGLLEQRPSEADLHDPVAELRDGLQGFMVRALPVENELAVISHVGGYLRYVPLQYRHCFIDLNQTFEDYQKKFSSKTRSTLNRKLKKYAEHCGGNIRWKTYKERPEIRDFFSLASAVSKLTYQEKLLDAGIPGSEEFMRQAESLAQDNKVRAYVLFHEDRPVAYLFCPVEDGVLIYAYLGYDPEYTKWSVGTVLQWLALEQLFSEGIFKAFDFTEGQSDHKRLFATHQKDCANVYFIKPSLINRLIVHGHHSMDYFSGWLGTKMQQWGIKSAVKRLLRTGSTGKKADAEAG